MFRQDIKLFTGAMFTVTFKYYPSTPDTREEPGTPDELGIIGLAFNGEELDKESVDEHLVMALENWLEDHYEDWYPCPEDSP